MMSSYRLLLVAGARPNFMKIAPIVGELHKRGGFAWTLVHTGQHYNAAMSDVFFDQLDIPRPDVDLGVGSASHARQTAAIMSAFEPVLLEQRPELVVVVGDVNSTLACALVAAKLNVSIAHIEAGLRSFDRSMPEEINRVLTDRLSELLFTTEGSAGENLVREGIAEHRIHFVGNVMIDTLLAHRDRARAMRVPESHGLTPDRYAVLTMHRSSNVDDDSVFARLLEAIAEIARDIPVVFPVHPRTRSVVSRSALAAALVHEGRLRLFDPLGYLEFLGLMIGCRVMLTDSGGIQEETTVLGVPCITLRNNTERPVTVSHGTNRVAGTDPSRILDAWRRVLREPPAPAVPPLWDGAAAGRIIDVIERHAGIRSGAAAVEATP